MKQAVIGLFGILFGTHAIAVWKTGYFMYPWIDIPLHILGGAFSALFCVMLLRDYPRLFKVEQASRVGTVVFLLGFTALVGIGWEFFEFGYDVVTNARGSAIAQLGIADTLGDLFFDLVGGAVIAIAAVLWGRR